MITKTTYMQLLDDRQAYRAIKEQLYQQNKNTNLHYIEDIINSISEQIRSYEPLCHKINQTQNDLTPFDENFLEPGIDKIKIMSIEEFNEKHNSTLTLINSFEELKLIPIEVITELQNVIIINEELIKKHIYINEYLAQFKGN